MSSHVNLDKGDFSQQSSVSLNSSELGQSHDSPLTFVKALTVGTLMAVCYITSNYSSQDVTLANLDTTKGFLCFPIALASWQEAKKPCVIILQTDLN